LETLGSLASFSPFSSAFVTGMVSYGRELTESQETRKWVTMVEESGMDSKQDKLNLK